ncbi:MAG: hypothetical protein ABFE07_17190 [Armatimonadia bacterium]
MLSVRPAGGEAAQAASDHVPAHGPTATGVCFAVGAVGLWFTGVSAMWEWPPPAAWPVRLLGPVLVSVLCALVFRSMPLCLHVGDDAVKVWTLAGPRRIPYSSISGAVFWTDPTTFRAEMRSMYLGPRPRSGLASLIRGSTTFVLTGGWWSVPALRITEPFLRRGEEAVHLIAVRADLTVPPDHVEPMRPWRWLLGLWCVAMTVMLALVASQLLPGSHDQGPPQASGAPLPLAPMVGFCVALAGALAGMWLYTIYLFQLPAATEPEAHAVTTEGGLLPFPNDGARVYWPTARGVCAIVSGLGLLGLFGAPVWGLLRVGSALSFALAVLVAGGWAYLVRRAAIYLRIGGSGLYVWTLGGPRWIQYSSISVAVPLSDGASPLCPDGVTLVLRGRWPTLTALTIAQGSLRNGEEAVRLIAERAGLAVPSGGAPWTERALKRRWLMVFYSLAMSVATGMLAMWTLTPPGVSGPAALSVVLTGMRFGLCLFAGGLAAASWIGTSSLFRPS